VGKGREKYTLVFEAQEQASKKVARLRKELASLGGPKMVKAQKEIKKLSREINQLSGTSKKGSIVFSRFTQGIAAGNIIANAATASINLLKKGVQELGNAVMIAANVEELGTVLNFVGQRAGYSSDQVKDYTMSLRKSGIAQKEANQALLRAIQGNIKLTDAVKLGRIAQDAAVIGQQNSSEAFQTLIDAVVKGRVVLLKSLGIQGTFEQSYKRMAKTLNKTQAEMTEAERLQARLNLVFEGGEVIAGAYTTAMGNASKQLRSMDRLVQDLQVSIGTYFVPTLKVAVIELTRLVKMLDSGFKGDSAGDVEFLSLEIGKFAASLALVAKVMFNFGQISLNTISLAVIAPIESAITVVSALVAVLRNPFSSDAWIEAGTIVTGIFDGFKTDFADIKRDIKDIDKAIIDFVITTATLKPPDVGDIAPIIAKVDIPRAIEDGEELVKGLAMLAGDIVQVTADSTAKTIDMTAVRIRRMTNTMKTMMGSALNNMVDRMLTGRESLGQIFKDIAKDFMNFFIKQALAAIANVFIPGLGSMLGGIFDTPVNDRMAAEQGKHFAQWFHKGAFAEFAGGSELAVRSSGVGRNISAANSNIGNGSSGGSNVVMLNVSVSGNVMTEDFVESKVAPSLQRLIDNGRTLLSVDSENETGSRHVSIR
jgi:hypothetical protein